MHKLDTPSILNEAKLQMRNEMAKYHHKTRSINSVQSDQVFDSPNGKQINVNGSFNDSNNGSPKYK